MKYYMIAHTGLKRYLRIQSDQLIMFSIKQGYILYKIKFAYL